MGIFKGIMKILGFNISNPRKNVLTEQNAVETSPFSFLHSSENTIDAIETPARPSVVDDPDKFVFNRGQMPRATLGLYYSEDGVFLIRHPDENRAGLILQFGGGETQVYPLSGDWNGDGLHGIGLYEAHSGLFVLRDHPKSERFDYQFVFGPAGQGWLPLTGDWDGDGVHTIGLYNPVDSAFFLSNRLDGGDADHVFHFGPAGAGWLPLAGDWNGDGKHSIGLYNPTDGRFYLRNSLSGGDAEIVLQFGPVGSAMLPLAGDWEGKGAHTVALYDRDNGMFYQCSLGGDALESVNFGSKPDKALPLSFLWI